MMLNKTIRLASLLAVGLTLSSHAYAQGKNPLEADKENHGYTTPPHTPRRDSFDTPNPQLPTDLLSTPFRLLGNSDNQSPVSPTLVDRLDKSPDTPETAARRTSFYLDPEAAGILGVSEGLSIMLLSPQKLTLHKSNSGKRLRLSSPPQLDMSPTASARHRRARFTGNFRILHKQGLDNLS